ncbi:MAG: competence/damage-inducible protein A [Filomicrobium sp.]
MSEQQTSPDAPSTDPDVTAAILVIGDEILSGRTKEANAGYIADIMTAIGIRLREVRVVADDEDDIVSALNALRTRYTYVFTTGGIGPTHDDITAECVAKAFGVGIDVNEDALAMMRPYYEARGVELTPSRLRMARIPHGGELIKNRITAAPGFRLQNVFVLAGVPSIMQVMLDAILPHLRTGRKILSRTIKVAAPEGDIADLFTEHAKKHPDVSMGSYPSFSDGKMRCELVLRAIEAEKLTIALAALQNTLEGAGIPHSIPEA